MTTFIQKSSRSGTAAAWAVRLFSSAHGGRGMATTSGRMGMVMVVPTSGSSSLVAAEIGDQGQVVSESQAVASEAPLPLVWVAEGAPEVPLGLQMSEDRRACSWIRNWP